MNAPTRMDPDFGGLVCLAKMMAVAPGDAVQQASYALARGWTRQAAIAKAAMAAVDTVDAAALVAPLGSAFARALAPSTIIGKMTGMRRAPFQQAVIRSNVLPGAGWVGGESPLPIPVIEGDFSTVVVLRRTTVASTTVITQELGRAAGAAAIERMGREMIAGLRAEMDTAFIDPGNPGEAGVRPAAISHAAPTFTSNGSSVIQIDADLQSLVGSLVDNNIELVAPVWIMSPATAAHLAAMRTTGGSLAYAGLTARGGSLVGFPAITSASVPSSVSGGTIIVLVDADQIEYADDGESDVETSEHAALQMDSTPSAGARPLVSLWQNNLIGVRVTRTVAWRSLRDEAVAVLTGVTF